jgi:Mn2+/Fe2+ NRAMP family transporter
VAEAASWRSGMDEKLATAQQFYGVMAVAMLAGTVLSIAHANAIKLLIWSAVINGLLAPPLVVLILVVCNNRAVMGQHRNGRVLNVLGAIAGTLMTAAGLGLVWSWIRG